MSEIRQSKGSVILVHGILTHADWYRDIRDALESYGFRVHLTNYGSFDLFRFLLPTSIFRDRVREKIFRQIRMAIQSDPEAEYSIIAHSFGTYIVSCVLKDEFDLRINRIIFAGSVVRYDFPFEQFSERFNGEILNEVVAKDPWPAIAESITTGYGSAGTFGFKRRLVYDRWIGGEISTGKADVHSAVLNSKHAIEYWIPFLERGEIITTKASTKVPFWIRFLNSLKIKYWILISVIALALVTLGVALYSSKEVEVKMYPGKIGWQLSDESVAATVNARMDMRCPLEWIDEHCDSGLVRRLTGRSWRGVSGYDEKLNSVLFPDEFIFSFRDPEHFWFELKNRFPDCVSISAVANDVDISLDPECDLARKQ